MFFSIHHRNPKLKTVSEVDAIPPEIKKPTDQTSLAKERLRARIAELASDPTEENLKMIDAIAATIRSL